MSDRWGVSMALQLQDFGSLVKLQAAAAAVATRQLIDVSVGSVLRAVLEANASIGLWLQWLIVEVLATTRAATSAGADLDSWVADFGMSRLPGVPAQGVVTLSRVTAGLPASVPVGTVVRTGLGPGGSVGQSFGVVADALSPAWDGAGFTIDAVATAIDVPVVALSVGQAGNVRAGEIGLLGVALAGVDAVTNAVPLSGGLDAESDAALRVRFGGFIDSRTRATSQAVGFAISGLAQGLSYSIAERVDSAGAERPGHFTVTLDDGTGTAPRALLDRAAAAIDLVRPIGGTFSVRGPTLVRANVVMQVSGPALVVPLVRAAVGAYVAALPIGGRLVLSRLTQVAHEASPLVASVYGITVNGLGADLVVPANGLVRAGTLEISA